MAISTPDGSRTLASILGASGRILAAPEAAVPSPPSSTSPSSSTSSSPNGPSVTDEARSAASTAAVLTQQLLTQAQPGAPKTRKLPTSIGEARRVFAEQEARIGTLEKQLHEAFLRVGRRTSEARSLEARLNALLPVVDQLKLRDEALAQAQAALAAAEHAIAELGASRDMRREVNEAI